MLEPYASECFALGRAIEHVIAGCIAAPLGDHMASWASATAPVEKVGRRFSFLRTPPILSRHDSQIRELAETTRTVHEEMKQSMVSAMETALEAVKDISGRLAFVSVEAQAERVHCMLQKPFDATKLRQAAEEMAVRMQDELTKRCFIYLDASAEKQFRAESLFGADVQQKFHAVGYDLAGAGKCLALARSTAAVFHLMRVAERGLSAVRESLRIPMPSHGPHRTWGWILDLIDKDIDRRNKGGLWNHADDSNKYRGFYASFDGIKNAFRDPTFHIESGTIYTESEARHINDLLSGLMKRVASLIDQNGEPKQT